MTTVTMQKPTDDRSPIEPGLKVGAPNAATIAAMREARSMKRARFGSAQKLFADLEEAGAAKADKPAKRQR